VRCSHYIVLTYSTASATALIQQNHDTGEPEGDVLKKVDALTRIINILCTKYKELGADAMPSSPDGVAEPTKPVVEQQEQQLRLLGALRALDNIGKCLPLREHELAAVHEVVSAAIAGNTGAARVWCLVLKALARI
jgi:hypothetical protein